MTRATGYRGLTITIPPVIVDTYESQVIDRFLPKSI